MASWMLVRASSSVSPSDQHPGSAGTDTLVSRSSETFRATDEYHLRDLCPVPVLCSQSRQNAQELVGSGVRVIDREYNVYV